MGLIIIATCLTLCWHMGVHMATKDYYKRRLYSDPGTTFIEVKSSKGTVPISMDVLTSNYATHIEHAVMFLGKTVIRRRNDFMIIKDDLTGQEEIIDIEMEVLLEDLMRECKTNEEA